MPPKRSAEAARKRENMYFEPGVRGRKTGLTVPDTGIRDEMGMEPIDDLFSSPEKTVIMGPPAQPTIAAAQSARKRLAPAPKVAVPAPGPAPAKQQKQQMQPTSLEAPKPAQSNGTTRKIPTADETNSYEASMSIVNSTMPEPTAVLSERRKSMHAPLPKSSSPKKTFLGSPAKRHPSIQPGESSPTRGTIMSPQKKMEKEPVARKLNFSNADAHADGDDVFAPLRRETVEMQTVPRSPAPAVVSRAVVIKTPATVNGKRKRASTEEGDRGVVEDVAAPEDERSMPGAWEEPTPFPSQRKSDRSFDLSPSGLGDAEFQPMQMDDDIDDYEEQNFEQLLERTATPPEPESARALAIKKRGRASLENQKDAEKKKGIAKGKSVAVAVAVAPTKKPGHPKSKEKEKEAVIPMVQAEQYLEIEASRIYSDDEAPTLPPLKRSKLASKDINRKISIKKATQLAKEVESSPMQIQRGPPRPRQQGLFITRRETPAVGPFATTRVGLGRPRVKPMAHWKRAGEGMEEEYKNELSYMVPMVQQPLYRDEVDLHDDPATKKKSAQQEDEEEEEDAAEPWESAPGRISGPVKEWSSTGNSDPAEREDEIAFSGPAIITRPIPGSEVQFAKTLTLPFFGSGMVDLPAGAVKRPKNSRKMQMVFFVFKGRVKVTVNGTEFRIGEGGMWQVPRGNMYSIENEGEKEARIFFSQGCEVAKEE